MGLSVLDGLDDAAENGLDGAPYCVEELAMAAAGEIRELRQKVEDIAAGKIAADQVKTEWEVRDAAMREPPRALTNPT